MVVETITDNIPIEGMVGLDYSSTVASVVRDIIQYRANSFIVENADGTFSYFPVKYREGQKGQFFEFISMPPIIKHGIACIDNKMYFVQENELIRGKINANKLFTNIAESGTEESSEGTDGRNADIGTTLLGPDLKPRISKDYGIENTQDANLAYKDQIESLLDFENLKEGQWF